MQSKIIILDNVSLKDFKERFQRMQSSFLHRVHGYGKHSPEGIGPYFWQATRPETTKSHGGVVFSFFDIETNALVFSVDVQRYRKDALEVRIAWEEEANGMALSMQYWFFAMFGGSVPGLEELENLGESLFMPLMPGVKIVELPTTPRRLLEALRLIVSETGESELLIDELHYRVSWRGLAYLKQKPETWPNPLTIQATIENDKGDISELARFQIQQTHTEKVRLAYRGNPDLMKLAPIAQFVNLTVQAWLAGWENELSIPNDQTGREKEEQPSPEGQTPEGGELPDTPPVPGQNGATWDDAFDWYYRIPRHKCQKLEDLAKLIMMEYGTVRKEHSKYVAQHGKRPMPRNG